MNPLQNYPVAVNPPDTCGTNRCAILSVVPGAVATIACLVGLVYLNIIQQHYVSIACGIGVVGGIFTIYQAYRFEQMKSFQENNAVFQKENTSFQVQIGELKEQVANAENMLLGYKRQNQELGKNVRNQAEENQKLKANIEKLNQEISSLNNINTTLEQNLQEQITQLQTVSSSLKEVESAVFSNHRLFGEKVAMFSENVAALQTVSTQINSSTGLFKKQSEQTTEFSLLVKKIFNEFEKWKDPESIEQKLNLYQNLQEKVWEMERLITVNEAQAKITTKNIDQLKGVRQQFEDAFDILKERVEQMSGVLEQKKMLLAGINKLVSEIKELPPGVVLPKSVIELISALGD